MNGNDEKGEPFRMALLFWCFFVGTFEKVPTPPKLSPEKVVPDGIFCQLPPPSGGSTPILLANRRNGTTASG